MAFMCLRGEISKAAEEMKYRKRKNIEGERSVENNSSGEEL